MIHQINSDNFQYYLRRLGMAGTVLHIGSHPDDEDIGLLTYIAHKHCARVVYWSATRGEGGQNRIAPYLGTSLGIFRSWESNNARAIDGGECLYGPFIDFGYSKTAEECLQKWGKYNVVKEIVRAIRLVQPQIVVSRWRGIADDFHGQHQAIGQATYDAFEAAGDRQKFSELEAEGLAPWQPLKFYHTCNNSGGDQTAGGAANVSGNLNPVYEAEDQVIRINTGEFDSLGGLTYQEQAWLAYLKHQSQGLKLLPKPGDFFYYFSLHKSLVCESEQDTDIYHGLDPSLTGLADYSGAGILYEKLVTVKASVDEAVQCFRYDTIEYILPLLKGLNTLRKLYSNLCIDSDDVTRIALKNYLACKITDFETVISYGLGLRLEVTVDDGRVTPGQDMLCQIKLWNHRHVPVDKIELKLNVPQDWQVNIRDSIVTAENNPTASHDYEIKVSEQTPLSCPYWLKQPHNIYRYQWSKTDAVSYPFDLPIIRGECQFSYNQTQLTLNAPALFREKFAGGYRELPLAIIPPISIQPANLDKVLLPVSSTEQILNLPAIARSNMEHSSVEGQLRLEAPANWTVEPEFIDLRLGKVGSSQGINFKVIIPENTLPDEYALRYVVRVNDRDYDIVLNAVRMGMPGIPSMPDESNCIKEEFVLEPAIVKIQLLDVKFVTGQKYAYIQGVSEQILQSLSQFNLDFKIIADSEMGFIDLDRFDAILIGPNAYLIRDELAKNANRFLEYVERGGTLIVQHQGYDFQGKGYTPYPFEYAQPHDRVSFEEDPSPEVLQPNHFLANYPNLIRAKDFLEWTQEVGLYFFNKWDKRYESIFSCHDPGEEPKHGCLLIANYGRGTYLYSGFSFFRQLRVGTPGAFRLFANILAVPASRL